MRNAKEDNRRFGIFSPDFEGGRLSGSLAGSERFGRVNPNAPWKVSGEVAFTTDAGTIGRFGLMGYRNSQVPLFMNQLLGGSQDLTLPRASFTDLSQREVQWVFTAGVEKTLYRSPSGTMVGGRR
jgi:hypothetical protein